MNWTCPHCEHQLASEPTPSAPSAASAPEGWAYARCGHCLGLSIVHRETSEALRIRKIEPKIEAIPVAGPIQVPPPPVSTRPSEPVVPSDPPARTRRVVHAWTFAVAIAVVGAGTYLVEEQRTRLARSIAAQAIAQELPRDPAPAPAAIALAPALAPAPLRDSVQSTSASIARGTPAPGVESPETFEIQARDRTANLHSGPGSEYSVLGVADPEERYPVLEMTRHWFKIPLGNAGQAAWVRRGEVDVRADASEASDHD